MDEIKGYANFLYFGSSILRETISKLLNCSVRIWSHEYKAINQKYNINLNEKKERFVYVIDENTVVLSTKIYYDKVIYAIVPFVLYGVRVSKINGTMLNNIASSISHVLSESYESRFRNGQLLFSDSLARRIIANTFSKHAFNTDNVMYLILFLQKLCNTTFENERFKTGFIITRSLYAYNKKNGNDRQGELINLNDSINLLSEGNPNKRFWFLVDGNKSFYVLDKTLAIRGVFIRNDSDNSLSSYIDSYSLSRTLLGNDVAFRIISSTQYSVLCSTGIEFINIENTWKIRDYRLITEFLQEITGMEVTMIRFLLFYILFCSQNSISSIIWIPATKDESVFARILLSSNSLFERPILISNATHRTIIKRLISSDGVTVINHDGSIARHGCIVDLSEVKASGLVGTGENAARLLSKWGTSIKISKDGNIKMFYDFNSSPLIF